MKKIVIKGNEYYFDFVPQQDWYEIKAFNEKKEVVGFVSMLIRSERCFPSIWLMKIFVNESERYQGIGQKLIEALECFAKMRHISYIEGKFYPDNSYARTFYEKNGYEIWKDDYETFVSKTLTKNNNNTKEMLGELFKQC